MNTVKIKAEKVEGNGLGFVVINESDYDPDLHDLYVEEAAEDANEEEKTVATKDELIAEAAKLKVASPSVLARMSIAKLTEEIAKAKEGK